MVEDLPTEEAVLRSDVALDVDEAEYPPRVRVSQHQGREPSHRMAHKVEGLEPDALEHGPRRLHQERDRYLRQVRTPGLTTARGVVGEERVASKALYRAMSA